MIPQLLSVTCPALIGYSTFRPGSIGRTVVIAFGANVPGAWGTPSQTFVRVQKKLAETGMSVLAASPPVSTDPAGGVPQPAFLNAVLIVTADAGSAALLRRLKKLESEAGRRPGRRWGPRPLDLDIIGHGGRVIGSASARPAQPTTRQRVKRQERLPPPPAGPLSRIALPHPRMRERLFVLAPLAAVAPAFPDPVTGRTAARLYADLALARRPRR